MTATARRQAAEGAAELDVARLRERFATLRDTTYLNSGSYGLLADSVERAFDEYLQLRREKGADWGAWVTKAERVRAQVAELLGADGDEIAVTASASAGMNALASALELGGARNRIVLSDFEFPTSAQIWHAQEPRGAIVTHVAESADSLVSVDALKAAIDDRTALVVLSHVCYRHGAKYPAEAIREIARHAHANGAYLLLDCYQSVGAETIDVRTLDVDFAAGGMLKYLLGTAGIGFLYARRAIVERLTPTASGWFAQADIDAMDIHANDPSPTARRFQAGTPPVPSCYAAEAGLGIILELGTDAIGRQVQRTTRYALERLKDAGVKIATPDDDSWRGPLVAIRSTDEQALVERLMARRIVTSSRAGNVRAGFHFYNDEADVDRFVAALQAERALLR